MLYESQLAIAAQRPVYGLTKNAGTMLVQQISKDVSPEELQIVSFHPGVLYSEEFKNMGLTETSFPFDDRKLLPSWVRSDKAFDK